MTGGIDSVSSGVTCRRDATPSETVRAFKRPKNLRRQLCKHLNVSTRVAMTSFDKPCAAKKDDLSSNYVEIR
jgi:hypothetical protein